MAVARDLCQVLDRTPPQSVELEMSVLGAIMLEPREAYAIAADYLREDSFYLDGHALLFRIMGELSDRGIPPDSVALIDELRARELLDKVGGTGVVMGMLNSVPTAANVEYHSRKVADKAHLRQLIRGCTEIIEEAYRQEHDAGEIVQRAALRIGQLANSTPAEMVPLADATAQYMTELGVRAEEARQLRAEGKTPRALRGLATGFYDVDRVLAGLRRKHLIIVAARPAQGKSAWVANVLDRVIAQGVPVAMFSMEMSCEEVTERLLSMGTYYNTSPGGPLCGVSSLRLTAGELNQTEWMVVNRRHAKMAKAPAYLCDKGTLRIAELRSYAGTLIRKHGVRLIIVDYLQLMTQEGQSRGRTEDVTQISRGLKQLAQDYGIPVIAVSQLSRSNEKEGNRKPQLRDLRESGAIEQDANVVMFLHDPSPGNDMPGKLTDIELLVRKNRNGPCCDIKLRWQKDIYRFYDASFHDQQ